MINLDLEDFSPEETKTTFKLWACDPGYSSPYVAVDGHGTSTYQIRQVSAKEYYHLGWLRLLIAELKRWKKNSSLSIPPVWYPSPVGLLPPQDYPTRSSLSGGCHRLINILHKLLVDTASYISYLRINNMFKCAEEGLAECFDDIHNFWRDHHATERKITFSGTDYRKSEYVYW